ncbi:MAG: hypothetical protein MZU97_08665 [Bacillus subtilis]|nr:hypothetical protein [Bacillus subtilis]
MNKTERVPRRFRISCSEPRTAAVRPRHDGRSAAAFGAGRVGRAQARRWSIVAAQPVPRPADLTTDLSVLLGRGLFLLSAGRVHHLRDARREPRVQDRAAPHDRRDPLGTADRRRHPHDRVRRPADAARTLEKRENQP